MVEGENHTGGSARTPRTQGCGFESDMREKALPVQG